MRQPTEQVFHRGDHVRIYDLSKSKHMSHFPSNQEAIVIGSYADQCGGGDNHRDYTLHLRRHGQVSWYPIGTFEMIEPNREDLLKEWEQQAADERVQKADLDWIFTHGQEVLQSPHGASIDTLAKGLGITNLWGSHGEGMIYYANCYEVLSIAQPFLIAQDKAGWLAFCEKARSENNT